jgi:hypothetical protein
LLLRLVVGRNNIDTCQLVSLLLLQTELLWASVFNLCFLSYIYLALKFTRVKWGLNTFSPTRLPIWVQLLHFGTECNVFGDALNVGDSTCLHFIRLVRSSCSPWQYELPLMCHPVREVVLSCLIISYLNWQYGRTYDTHPINWMSWIRVFQRFEVWKLTEKRVYVPRAPVTGRALFCWRVHQGVAHLATW